MLKPNHEKPTSTKNNNKARYYANNRTLTSTIITQENVHQHICKTSIMGSTPIAASMV